MRPYALRPPLFFKATGQRFLWTLLCQIRCYNKTLGTQRGIAWFTLYNSHDYLPSVSAIESTWPGIEIEYPLSK